MKFLQRRFIGEEVTELERGSFQITETDDFLDLIANAPLRKLLIHKEDLEERFFDLSSGFAGEVLQKVSNYGIGLTILGDFSPYTSSSLQAFIKESNRNGQVRFMALPEDG